MTVIETDEVVKSTLGGEDGTRRDTDTVCERCPMQVQRLLAARPFHPEKVSSFRWSNAGALRKVLLDRFQIANLLHKQGMP